MVHATLHKDLQLSKKSARLMIELLYCREMKKEEVMMCEALIAINPVIS
jgi:hypothetical protein